MKQLWRLHEIAYVKEIHKLTITVTSHNLNLKKNSAHFQEWSLLLNYENSGCYKGHQWQPQEIWTSNSGTVISSHLCHPCVEDSTLSMWESLQVGGLLEEGKGGEARGGSAPHCTCPAGGQIKWYGMIRHNNFKKPVLKPINFQEVAEMVYD